MADKDLIPLLDRIKDARVCTVGDVMTDRWVHGRVERISPEAPVPVFVQEGFDDLPGGAANVARNLTALGITGYRNMLGGHRSWGAPMKERFIVGRQQIFRRDIEKVEPLTQAEEDEVYAFATHNSIGCLILSDYGKGVLTPSLCRRLIEWAGESNIPVVVDPKGADWSKYEGATVITPNDAEFMAAHRDVGYPVPGSAILRTMGRSGMMLLQEGADAIQVEGRERLVYDVTGAGDTVVAVVAACLAVRIDLESAARIANAAAGVVVSKPGTAVCTLAELAEELRK